MAVINEKEIKKEVILEIAKLMAVAARTAPKARGNDNLEIAIITAQTIKMLSETMHEIGKKYKMEFFNRDAENILNSPAILLIGTHIKTQDIKKCGMCGFKNCSEKKKYDDTPCVFNTNDLGIAIGSAVSVASNHHIDNRVMFSIGQAALKLELLGKEVKIAFGIPLSATSKNPFFDRPPV
ncbi:MAG: ferredoxin [Bacteroidetes bacterium CG02_land_8_20_14_3_00_31_25]|nr:ferredoxin [Bacteroidota bacterium]PIV57729.1 MAG: ferredoxin [Bacteroidetes bacterium CG02_land_8_20_14_3_00_31_25]PIX35676.1 MAG: ferredoxin [Bacteroidetes bacterium CG_4_8_14_3_um_filter_31_14]PIY06663.1 MAG: ferredoxin [Bacteroidetes bacterium CG_4_10_14_3_um_filter_31_20]